MYIYLYLIFIYLAALGLHCLAGISLLAESRGPLPSCPGSPASHRGGLLGAEHSLNSCVRLVTPWHVGVSWTRFQAHVSCSGRQILYHWEILWCLGDPFLINISRWKKFSTFAKKGLSEGFKCHSKQGVLVLFFSINTFILQLFSYCFLFFGYPSSPTVSLLQNSIHCS